MNSRNMSILIANYKEHLQKMNDSLHDEIYKWDAVRYFQDNWDVDEENFGVMFENAISLASNIVNIGANRPAEGIVELAKYEDESMRGLFRDLFIEDNGDLKAREERIQDFIDKSEELRKQYAPDNWRYAQDYSSAIAYLALYSPDDNYLYSPSAIKRMVECLETGREIGKGKTFSLSKYYKLCDEIKEAVEADKELVEAHDAFLRDTAYPDEQHHILTYDFISCIETYQLSEEIKTVNKHLTKGAIKAEEEHMDQVEELEAKCQETRGKIAALQSEIEVLKKYELLGLPVLHKKYGEGKIVDRKEAHLMVDFNGTVKTFLLPEAFANKFLTTEDEEVHNHFTLVASKIKEEKILQSQLKIDEYELELLR